jgi:hypothetical protein
MKNKTKNAMTTRMNGQLVEVWLGKPDDPESEPILQMDIFWIPTLIAVLRQYTTKNK